MTDARDLYGLPLERFVAERSTLAKELRAGGRREEAEQVAKLRKPSVAAWAVNQLVRTQLGAVGELFKAGDQLQHAQAELLAGRGEPGALREASDRERTALEHLTSTARGLLSSVGHELSAMMLERVGDTLHAAAIDRDARAKVADGCLEHELRHVGLGAGALPGKRAAGPRRQRSTAQGKPTERLTREQNEQLKAARRAAADARRAAERAAREVRMAKERRDRAAAALDDAEAHLAEAQTAAEEAARDRERSERALSELAG